VTFISDQLFDCTRLRILPIVVVFTRFSPALDARKSYRADEVANTLEHVARKYGVPKQIRVDNGPEFISRALDLWDYMNGVTLDFSRPGMPTDSAFVENFNCKFWAECLNTDWFCRWLRHRQNVRRGGKTIMRVQPHSSIGTRPRRS
jgi:putative transposase